jgi:predicted nucleotidyltransferase
MKLTRPENQWLESYRRKLASISPAVVERMVIYGSKARGEAGPESDLDVLIIVTNRAAGQKRALRRIGYLLAADMDVVPSIMAYTLDEWETRKRSRSPFLRAVERDEVRVI